MNYHRKVVVVLQTLGIICHQLALALIEFTVKPAGEGKWEVRIRDDGRVLPEHILAFQWESEKG